MAAHLGNYIQVFRAVCTPATMDQRIADVEEQADRFIHQLCSEHKHVGSNSNGVPTD